MIDGKDIPTGKKLAALDLKVDTKADTIPVTVVNAVTGEKKVLQLALSYNGAFGFPMTLRLDVGKESAGLWANLYYYNESAGALEFQSAVRVGADGKADLPFVHASSYAVILDAESHAPQVWENPFTDVSESDWFYEAVLYVYHRGIMNGTGETTFSPYGDTTRAQLAAILWRLEGTPAPTGGGSFTDVPAGQYYTDAVAWCTAQGLVGGYGNGLFGPDDNITREQLVTILWRYTKYKGWDVSMGEDTNILSYADAFDVSEWAIPALQWACGAGIMSGTIDGKLNPQGGAARAELAAVLTRYLAEEN